MSWGSWMISYESEFSLGEEWGVIFFFFFFFVVERID
jgi:hypothetical protein